jgi:membrane protein DedA with SNARE-associated domain
MLDWIQAAASNVIQALQQGNPLVFGFLFVISTVIEFSIPFPSVQDAVLFYLSYEGRLMPYVPLVMLTLMAGRILGGSIVYSLAYFQGPRFTLWLDKRFPAFQRSASDLKSRLGNKTPVAVALGRLTPGLLVPTTLAAGTFRVKYLYFCIGVVISSILPDLAEIGSGLALKSGLKLAGIRPTPAFFLVTLAVIMVVIWLSGWLWMRHAARKGQHDSGSVAL